MKSDEVQDELELLLALYEGELECSNGVLTFRRAWRSKAVVVIRATLSTTYPDTTPCWSVVAPQLSCKEVTFILRRATEVSEVLKGCVQVRQVVEAIQEVLEGLSKERDLPIRVVDTPTTVNIQLQRRCVYFHHILSSEKRKCISNWASELQIGGFCKVGYPGILIVEGEDCNIVQYIRLLQQLRWKLMVVRGEESVTDGLRKLDYATGIVETQNSAEIAKWCEACGLLPLFRTSMKIFTTP